MRDRLGNRETRRFVQQHVQRAPRSQADAAARDDANAAETSSADEQQTVRYEIRPGDTLWDLAREFGVDGGWRALWNVGANRGVVGENPDLIHPGDVIEIPTSGRQSGSAERAERRDEGRDLGRSGDARYEPGEVDASRESGLALSNVSGGSVDAYLSAVAGGGSVYRYTPLLLYGFGVGESSLDGTGAAELFDVITDWSGGSVPIPGGGQFFVRQFHVIGSSDAVGSDERNRQLRADRSTAVSRRILERQDDVTVGEFRPGTSAALSMGRYFTTNETRLGRRKNRSVLVFDTLVVEDGRTPEPRGEVDPEAIDDAIEQYGEIESDEGANRRTAQLAEQYRVVLEHWKAKKDFRYWSEWDVRRLFMLKRGIADLGERETGGMEGALLEGVERQDPAVTRRLLQQVVDATALSMDRVQAILRSGDEDDWTELWGAAIDAFQTDGYSELTEALRGKETPRTIQRGIRNWIQAPAAGLDQLAEEDVENVYQYLQVQVRARLARRRSDPNSIYYVLHQYGAEAFTLEELLADPNRELEQPFEGTASEN